MYQNNGRAILLEESGGNIRGIAISIFIIILITTGCYGEKRDESLVISGGSQAWSAKIKVVFTSSEEDDTYYIKGNLEFQNHYMPKKVKYYLSYPAGESSGTSKGKAIKIIQSGGSRPDSTGNINDFAEKIILEVVWENEDKEVMKETIQFDD